MAVITQGTAILDATRVTGRAAVTPSAVVPISNAVMENAISFHIHARVPLEINKINNRINKKRRR